MFNFAAIMRRFLSLKVGLKPISWTSFSLNKKPETPLFTGNFRFFLVGCPDGLEPSTFRTTSRVSNILISLYLSAFPQILIFILRLFCGYLRKDRFCFNKSLKIWDESLLNSSSIMKWRTFFKSDAKVGKIFNIKNDFAEYFSKKTSAVHFLMNCGRFHKRR